MSETSTLCGGCLGLGAHRRYCPRHPDYHPWRRLADQAESIGDTIGSNDTALSNRAYSLAAGIRQRIADQKERTWAARPPSTRR